jgi:hypothetical protein
MPQSVNFQREGQQADDFSIQSYNFGGLNTTASRLNVPYSDATELLNTNVGLDGSLLKRKGTKYLAGLPSASTCYGTGFRSVLGYNFSILANNQNLSIYSRDNDAYSIVRNFPTVYDVSSSPQPTQWVQLPDVYSRLLALRSDKPPVEVYTLEQRYTLTPGVTNQVTLTASGKFTGDNPTSGTFSDLVYVTRGTGLQTRYDVGTVTYVTTGTSILLTLPVTFLVSETITVDVVAFRWAWWAESIKWYGDRFYDSLSRFNVTANDNNVAIPPALRSDLTPGEEQLLCSISKNSSSSGTYASAVQPNTADNYALSDGAVYVPGVDQYPQPAPYFITFGLTRTPLPQPPEVVKVLRFRELRFRQSRSIVANRLRVTVNDKVRTQDFSGLTSGTQRYVCQDPSGAVFINAAGQTCGYLAFGASVPTGVGASEVVTMTNIEALGILGSTALEVEESLFKSGAYRRCYGLGLFASYNSQAVYPSVGCVYQGRLALSGIATDKSRILISSIDPAEDRYSFFQVTDDLEGLATDPFDVVVSGGDSADFIVGMVEWNSSLFALTRRSVYRISGGDQPLTATRRLVTYISNIGLVNPRALVRTDTAVYYLSDGGVFNLTPRIEDSEFNAIEKSLKIRDLIVTRDANGLVNSAYLMFDSKQRRLMVALPNTADTGYEASDLLLLDTVRDAWTKYESLGQLRLQSMFESVDNRTGQYGVLGCTPRGTILFDSLPRYTDYTTTYTNVTSQTHNLIMGYAVAGVVGGQRYTIPKGIQCSTISSVKDLAIYVGSTSAPIRVNYTKLSGYVYLDAPTVTGDRVWFVSVSPVNQSAQGVSRYGTGNLYPYTLWLNNSVVTPVSETLSFNTVTNIASLAVLFTGLTTDVFTIGTHYFASYVSSMFTQQSLGALKRTKYAYLYFNNGETSNFTNTLELEQYSTRVNTNVAILYNSSDSAEVNVSADVYGYQDILWDNGYFDTVEASYRRDSYSLFKEPLIGVGYSYRLNIFSYDDARWHLVGFQIDASRSKGTRYVNSN